MCGIFGWSLPDGVLTPEQRAVLAFALALKNDDRGGDSWGAYVLNGSVNIARGLGKSIGNTRWPELAKDAKVLMAHTRKATSGKIIIENAHPFEIGNVVGAHNGWITNEDDLNKRYSRNFDVDSMHIFAHIQKGWRLNELQGAGAIEYTNKRKWPGRVNLCKVSVGGDLAICGLGQGITTCNGIIWSSTDFALRFALDAIGLSGQYFPYKVETGNIYCAENGKLGLQSKKHFFAEPVSWSKTPYYGTGTSYMTPMYDRKEEWDGGFERLHVCCRHWDMGRAILIEKDYKAYVERGALKLSIDTAGKEETRPEEVEVAADTERPIGFSIDHAEALMAGTEQPEPEKTVTEPVVVTDGDATQSGAQ